MSCLPGTYLKERISNYLTKDKLLSNFSIKIDLTLCVSGESMTSKLQNVLSPCDWFRVPVTITIRTFMFHIRVNDLWSEWCRIVTAYISHPVISLTHIMNLL